jgi:epoxyqueuosine reductase
MSNFTEKHTRIVKQLAVDLGFQFCGISKADFLESEANRLEKWLNSGFHGQMKYMENHFDKRLDPRKLVEGSKSVISLLLNYYPSKKQNPLAPKISKYAYGEDYHSVIKSKLKEFYAQIQSEIGEVSGRFFVDSAPVMDKVWAQKSGLGWMGKNGNIIHPKRGSFFFIAELIIDLELIPDGPIKDYCGTCTRCIDACPTDALNQPYVVDGSKCISYLTIELKDAIPTEFQAKMENWMFGCDICQDVCPWNRFSLAHTEKDFEPNSNLLEFSLEDWNMLSEESFQSIFPKSAVKRTKYTGLKRNLNFLDSKLDTTNH